jgi:O-antigen/teichoic acid export membrane protein
VRHSDRTATTELPVGSDLRSDGRLPAGGVNSVESLVEADRFEFGKESPSSYRWAVGGRVGNQLLQLLASLILARLLSPAQFGVYAAGQIVFALVQIFTDLGIGPAIVHRTKVDTKYLETAFWLNVLTGLVFWLASFGLGWLLANWSGYSELAWLVPTQSFAFAVSASVVGLAVMERRFEFKRITGLEAVAMVLGQAAAILVAAAFHSVVALAIAPIVTAVVLSGLVLAYGWHPDSLRPTLGAWSEILKFSSYLTSFNLTSYAARNSDSFVLARTVDAAQLGFYNRAYQIMLLPVSQVTQGLGRVLLPTFSRAKSKKDQLQKSYERAVRLATSLGAPLAAVLFAMAPTAIPVLYGPSWSSAVPLVRILAVSVPMQLVSAVHAPLYTANGEVRLLLRSSAVTSFIVVTTFAVVAKYGTTAVAWSIVANTAIGLPIVAYPILRKLRLSVRQVVLPTVWILGLSVGLGALLSVAPKLIAGSTVSEGVSFLIQVAMIVSVGMLWAIFRFRQRRIG